jgi:hypothetical protein
LQGCKMCVFEQRPFLELADILGCLVLTHQ